MKYKILVNKEKEFNKKFLERVNLIPYKDVYNNEILVEEKTLQAFLSLKEFLLFLDIDIGIISAYKDFDYTNKSIELSNNLEHYTGLALDIGINIDGEYLKEENDKTSEIFNTIHNNLYKYGFILRYPKDSEEITGYNYEPWHIRYVGEVVSKIIYDNNYTFEEYLKNFSCVLYINKPINVTSYDVVREISNIFGIKKVGHTGTLDPLATGVLLVTVGQATKIVELLTAEDKEYISYVSLGFQTDTYDITGEVINRKEIPNNIDLVKCLNSFKKTYNQEVPIYSAIKVKGKKLYEYARGGEDVILPKKEVTIKEIELLSQSKDSFTFKALVSKGTYIRSLINDIGIELGTYATMNTLERTKQGTVTIKDTNSLEDIKNNNYKYHLVDEVLDLPQVVVSNDLEKKISNGVRIVDKWDINDKVIFKRRDNKILGIYVKDGNMLRVWKNFF